MGVSCLFLCLRLCLCCYVYIVCLCLCNVNVNIFIDLDNVDALLLMFMILLCCVCISKWSAKYILKLVTVLFQVRENSSENCNLEVGKCNWINGSKSWGRVIRARPPITRGYKRPWLGLIRVIRILKSFFFFIFKINMISFATLLINDFWPILRYLILLKLHFCSK